MTSFTGPLSDAEVDQLADFLDSLPSPEAMNLERLDGFFCALIVGPDLVMPSEYWPYIIGAETDSDPAFSTMEQAQTIMSLVTRHWNTIAGALNNGDLYLPLLFEDENGAPSGNDWASGFMEGVALRHSSWQAFLDDEELAVAIVPMMALAHENDPDLKSQFEPLLSEEREQILHLMTASIAEIYDYFAPMRAQPPPATFVHSQPKIGRNDPCPCGSGKKYKHCCMTRLQ